MIERDEVVDSASRALALLTERMIEKSSYGVYLHAQKQLTRIIEDLSYPYLPPVAERAWVDIGIMAVKELDAADPELANALMDVDYNFKHAR